VFLLSPWMFGFFRTFAPQLRPHSSRDRTEVS
jgi:hypothetical protein